jgi:hypothetical protein
MGLLEELQQMYGQSAGPNDQLLQMLGGSAPPAPTAPTPMGDPSATGQPPEQPREFSDLDVMEMYSQMVNENAANREAGGGGGGGAPPGMHAQSVTQKTESGGVPSGVAAQGVAVRGAAEAGDEQIKRDRLEQQAKEAEKQAAEIRAQVETENQKRAAEENENAQKQQRLRAQQADLAKQNDEPVNARRYFDNMNVFSKGTAILSAALYGYLNPKATGPAPVVESLMQMAQEDTRAQVATNAQNRDQRNNVMAQYEREYGDTTLVAKRLEADKLLTFAKEAKAQGLDAKSAEARANAEDIGKQLLNRVGVLHQQIQEATYGKPVETTTTYQPNAPKGAGMAAAYDKAAKAYQSLAAAGMEPEKRIAALKAMGLPTDGFGGKTADETEKERKAAEINPTEKQKLIEKVDGLTMAMQGFEELDSSAGVKRDADGELRGSLDKLDKATPGIGQQAYETLSGLVPGKPGETLKRQAEAAADPDTRSLRRAASKIAMGLAHAESGAGVNEGEAQRYLDMLDTSSTGGFSRSSPEVFREQRQKYRNLVREYGKETIDDMLRKSGKDPSLFGA